MAFPVEAWRPPTGAVRDAERDAWEVSERDAGGVRDGDSTLYRDDGSVLMRCRYREGVRSGTFHSYHPNGDVESEGRYLDGALDGALVRYTSEAPGAVPLRSCCVPPGASMLRAHYQRGTFLGETFYDREGHALRSDGGLLPERATGVPDDATFEEGEERWVLRIACEDDRMLRRSFDLDGHLVEEIESDGARRLALRSFHASGLLAREYHYDEAGLPHGSCLLRYGDDTPYADRAIREVRGAFEHGKAVGSWGFFDAGGRELLSQERGEPLSDEALRELLGRERAVASAEVLLARAEGLFGERRVREALFVAARAAARAGSPDRLIELLGRAVVPLERDAANARAVALDQKASANVGEAFDSLLAGGDPAKIFRLLATLIPASRAAARDLVEAALLLDPQSNRALLTRSLVRIEQGDDCGALADIAELGSDFAEAALQVRDLARVLYQSFTFALAREPPPEPNDALAEVVVEQSLEAIRRTIAVYATRLSAIRAELVTRLGGGALPWLFPEPSSLLEAGPVELRCFTATITDEDESGSETSDVRVDETVELSDASVATLLIVARADFDALSWLCWAAGLDALALPTVLTPRPAFPAAVNEAMHRCFRAHDQVRTAGLVSRSRNVEGFEWEGLPVEALSSRLAEIAAHQYLERRALFLFLLFPQNVSPFQSDLREV